MSVAIITGSAGLIGSEAVEYFVEKGMHVVGIDNNMRKEFFGEEASTEWNRNRLQAALGEKYTHADIDIRDDASIFNLFKVCLLYTSPSPRDS